MVEIVGSGLVLMVLGALMVLIAGWGMLRLPDLYLRTSASTKAATLGLGSVLIGLTLIAGDWGVTGRVVVILLFVLLTVPIAAHALGQAAYFSGVPLWRETVVDELNRQPRVGAKPRISTTLAAHAETVPANTATRGGKNPR